MRKMNLKHIVSAAALAGMVTAGAVQADELHVLNWKLSLIHI